MAAREQSGVRDGSVGFIDWLDGLRRGQQLDLRSLEAFK
jgi:hypothetical protein